MNSLKKRTSAKDGLTDKTDTSLGIALDLFRRCEIPIGIVRHEECAAATRPITSHRQYVNRGPIPLAFENKIYLKFVLEA